MVAAQTPSPFPPARPPKRRQRLLVPPAPRLDAYAPDPITEAAKAKRGASAGRKGPCFFRRSEIRDEPALHSQQKGVRAPREQRRNGADEREAGEGMRERENERRRDGG